MKTRYSSLVTVKKSAVQKSEQEVQKKNAELKSADEALELAYTTLYDITTPHDGVVANFLTTQALLHTARAQIKHNKEWQNFAKDQLQLAKDNLKKDMIEYEKFHYLELEEIKKLLVAQAKLEAKELDEIALMSYANRIIGDK